MDISQQQLRARAYNKSQDFIQGAIDIVPLSIAVLPWGILAGSVAIDAGLSIPQAVAMSAIVFAGAAQLVSLGMWSADATVLTIAITVFFLTSQHFIYALTLRKDISVLASYYRIPLGFLLTDELFAVAMTKQQRRPYYLLGAGLCFYLAWVLFSLLGIYLASTVPNLSGLHLDFSIVAVLVAIIVPFIKNLRSLIGVIITILSSLCLTALHVKASILLSGMLGMFVAVCLEHWEQKI